MNKNLGDLEMEQMEQAVVTVRKLLRKHLGALPLMIAVQPGGDAVVWWTRSRAYPGGKEYGTHLFSHDVQLVSGHYFLESKEVNAHKESYEDFLRRIDTI